MQVNAARLDKLVHLSKTNAYDAYNRFSWPETLPVDRLWCDENLLTTFGTDLHTQMSDQEKFELSKWEAVHFYSLNVHGIKSVLEFVTNRIHTKRYADISDYLHIFIDEENAHMWFFAQFCRKYGGKMYPSMALNLSRTDDPAERDLYMFASTLIFEEFVDFYNHRVAKNTSVPEIVRQINRQHHVDESRHVSFGRDMVEALYKEIIHSGADHVRTHRIGTSFKGMILYFIGMMYNAEVYDDAGLTARLGFKSGAAMRNAVRNADARKEHHVAWFSRTASFFQRLGIIDDVEFIREN